VPDMPGFQSQFWSECTHLMVMGWNSLGDSPTSGSSSPATASYRSSWTRS